MSSFAVFVTWCSEILIWLIIVVSASESACLVSSTRFMHSIRKDALIVEQRGRTFATSVIWIWRKKLQTWMHTVLSGKMDVSGSGRLSQLVIITKFVAMHICHVCLAVVADSCSRTEPSMRVKCPVSMHASYLVGWMGVWEVPFTMSAGTFCLHNFNCRLFSKWNANNY